MHSWLLVSQPTLVGYSWSICYFSLFDLKGSEFSSSRFMSNDRNKTVWIDRQKIYLHRVKEDGVVYHYNHPPTPLFSCSIHFSSFLLLLVSRSLLLRHRNSKNYYCDVTTDPARHNNTSSLATVQPSDVLTLVGRSLVQPQLRCICPSIYANRYTASHFPDRNSTGTRHRHLLHPKTELQRPGQVTVTVNILKN